MTSLLTDLRTALNRQIPVVRAFPVVKRNVVVVVVVKYVRAQKLLKRLRTLNVFVSYLVDILNK